MSVANEILRQLGGNKFVVMTGAKNFLADGNTLRMTLPKNGSKANRLWITLDEGEDLYSMRFFRYVPGRLNTKTWEWSKEKVDNEKIYDHIFCDQLQEVFTQHTKMYTHL